MTVCFKGTVSLEAMTLACVHQHFYHRDVSGCASDSVVPSRA